MPDDKAKETLSRFDELKTRRDALDNDFQKIVDYVRPDGCDFSGSGPTESATARSPSGGGGNRSRKIWDSTPREALLKFAAGIGTNLTNPSQPWFRIGLAEVDDEQLDHEALLWLDQATEIVNAAFNNAEGGFHTSLGEAYQDLGSYGTDIIHPSWNPRTKAVQFRTFPLGQCWLDEGEDCQVDTNFRLIEMTRRQVLERFGSLSGSMIPDIVMRERDSTRRFNILHAVQPRRDAHGLRAKNKPYASHWVETETKTTILESGFDEFPYAVSRWQKRAGEVYGYGPGRVCLPDILMLNRMEQLIIKRAGRMVDPPLMVPDQGFVLPMRTGLGDINFYEAHMPGDVKELFPNMYQPIGLTLEERGDLRDRIGRAFHNDLFNLGKDNIEMKATEVIERRDEKLRQLAPMIGRQATEKLDPLIAMTFAILDRHNRFPQAPASLAGQRLKAKYVSPAAMAQFAVQASNMRGYAEDLVGLAQAYPQVLDSVDPNRLSSELARARQVPTVILRDAAEVEEIQANREQSEQLQAAAQAAQPAASAIKDVAQAQALSQ